MAGRGLSAHPRITLAWLARLGKQVEYLRRFRDRETLRALDRVAIRDLLEMRVREEAVKPFWKP
jgi:hypothetical protein